MYERGVDIMTEQNWTTVVHGDGKKTKIDWHGLAKCRDLIVLWVRRNFVAQYKQTVLGPAWAIIQPFFTTIVYTVFFGNVAGLVDNGLPAFVFYLSGNIIWSLFANSLTHTSNTFISNSAIMGKVYFPRLVMPIATAISQFISFFIQFGFLIIAIVVFVLVGNGGESLAGLNAFLGKGGENITPHWQYILMTPVLLVQTALLGMGFGMIISSLTTKYRDLTMVVGFGMSLWSYASPVAYDMFIGKMGGKLAEPGWIHTIYMLNPMTPIINLFRYAYLGCGKVEWLFYGISWIITILVAAIGIKMFSRVEKTFMDTI